MTSACWITPGGGHRPAPLEVLPHESSPVDGAFRQIDGPPYRQGWIGLSFGSDGLTVRLDVDSIAPDALVAALEIVDEAKQPVSLIRRRAGAWLGERLQARADVDCVLSSLLQERGSTMPGSVRIEPIDLGSLGDGNVAPLLRIGFEAWDRGKGFLTDATFGSGELLATSQIQLIRDDGGGVRFFFIGPQSTTARTFGRRWSSQAAGAPAVPDAAFDRQVTQSYSPVQQSWEPRADTVHCQVQLPDGKRIWAAYQRLVLPMRFLSGVPVINSLAEFVPFGSAVAASGGSGPGGCSSRSSRLH